MFCPSYLVKELEGLLVLCVFELVEEVIAAQLVRHAVDRRHQSPRSHHIS